MPARNEWAPWLFVTSNKKVDGSEEPLNVNRDVVPAITTRNPVRRPGEFGCKSVADELQDQGLVRVTHPIDHSVRQANRGWKAGVC